MIASLGLLSGVRVRTPGVRYPNGASVLRMFQPEITMNASYPCPQCQTLTRVVSLGGLDPCPTPLRPTPGQPMPLQAETACGHNTADQVFIQRCLAYEQGTVDQDRRLHKWFATQRQHWCPCHACEALRKK